jgi:hypothetical protein
MLQTARKKRGSEGVKTDGNHWTPHRQPDLSLLVRIVRHYGWDVRGPLSLDPNIPASDFHFFEPLQKYLAGK